MPRERDLVWDTLVELYGDVANDNERGRRNKAVQQLKQAGATPEEIRTRFERYADIFGEDTINTDTALASNWSRLAEDKPKNEVASTFRAIWPNGKFDEAGWRTILRGFFPSEIMAALEKLGYSHQYPPGAIEVKKLLITNRLGSEAPLQPEEAISLVRTYRDSVQNSFTSNGIDLPPMVRDALELTKARSMVFDEAVFLSIYREALADFYSSWQPQHT